MCIYINVERGKRVSSGEKFGINGIELNEVDWGEKCKYHGQDEDVAYDCVLNKDRITKGVLPMIMKNMGNRATVYSR